MSHIFGRPTRGAPPVAAGGKGRYAHHDSGQRYLDVSGGARGDHILLAPPFTIEDAQRDELADKRETAVSAVI